MFLSKTVRNFSLKKYRGTKDLTKIVITGGPCGGKTTILTNFVSIFEARGFRVYCVPEAATMLSTAGFKLN
jgi:nucleoside-triphosphatase THEP1